MIGGRGPAEDPMVPKKYNMKKEPERVRNFVKLLTTPMEENSIDSQIEAKLQELDNESPK